MGMLQVKNLPDEMHAALAARARADGTTMSEYVTRLIRRDLARPTLTEWVAEQRSDAPRAEVDVAHVLDEVRVEYDATAAGAHTPERSPAPEARARR
ncbi:FitA-like ribbon-helix-helix domain-containing protein [Cellulosimicrobium protaetiae]|uniref:Antitoxin FitA-like ribbon-helix-helix domain-containing protein n=1 Tax=Cellulosimicrobium protaetiae TaxID=2587808 RepID=A0A6M5U8Q7_9MICO|nr:hypothetical protein [Cellulosimicrobium protaetiae]QJW34896.1 hypothetical protein FIC82_000450 [Cellulosimicrobium protaetiae]